RRRHAQAGRLLVRRGATEAQILATTVVPTVLSVALGLALGLAAGAGAVAFRSRDPTGPTTARAVAVTAVGSALPVVLLLALASTLLTVATLRWPERAARSTRVVLHTAGAAVLLAVPVLLGAGAGSGTLVVLLLGLGTALVAARLWSPLVGLGLRLTRRRVPHLPGVVRQAGLLAARRRPLVAAVSSGFVAAACCSLVFATAYAGSLARSAGDQAAFAVPLDVSVGASAQVPGPLDAVAVDRLEAAGPGVVVHPVVSSTVTVYAGTAGATALPLTGLDPEVWTSLHEPAATTGSSVAPDALARLLDPGPGAGDRPRPTLPSGRLSIPAFGATDDVVVRLWVAGADARERSVDLTRRGQVLLGDLGPTPTTLRAVELVESASHLMHRQHGVGEGGSDRALASGTLRLAAPDGAPAPAGWSWRGWGSEQAEVTAGDTLTVRYRIGDDRVVLTPGFVARSDRDPLPVFLDRRTARRLDPSGRVGLTVNGVTAAARVVTVLDRMPGLEGSFVVADRGAVERLLDRTAPGTAAVTQLWVSAPGPSLGAVRQVLTTPPASAASVRFRSDLAAGLSRDPVTSRAEGLLGVAGALALLLAWAALAVAVRAEVEDAAGDHLALELDGIGPGGLRRVLAARWVSVVAVAVPIGVGGGLGMTALALRLLTEGPDGRPVVPPLHLVLGTPALAGAVALAVLGTLAVALATGRTAFRSARPQPPETDLR
ncbi:MAG: hypothetical protein JWP61_843, partial [Friedmanniella sp.]|nr:hypothetical protein [Friedmanniella sp.]